MTVMDHGFHIWSLKWYDSSHIDRTALQCSMQKLQPYDIGKCCLIVHKIEFDIQNNTVKKNGENIT